LDPVDVRGSLLSICHDARIATSAQTLRDSLDGLNRYWLDLSGPASPSDFSGLETSADSIIVFLERQSRGEPQTIGRAQPAVTIPAETDWASLVERVGADSAASVAAAMQRRYPGKSIARRAVLARLGRDVLAAGNVRAATALYRFNAMLFPNTVSSYDDLADAYRQANDSARVVESYQRLVAVVPLDASLDSASAATWRSYAARRIAEYGRVRRAPNRLSSPFGRLKGTPMAATRDDLLQGTLDMLVLKALQLGVMHGWGITERLEQGSRGVFQLNQGSLYPALYRLERQGLVTSSWKTTENNRRARYYGLTAGGRRALANEQEKWERQSEAVNLVLRMT
jgi:transcriptional regulator